MDAHAHALSQESGEANSKKRSGDILLGATSKKQVQTSDSTEQPSSPSAAAAGDLFAAGIPRKKRTMTYIVDDSLSEEKQVRTSDSTEQPSSPSAAAAGAMIATPAPMPAPGAVIAKPAPTAGAMIATAAPVSAAGPSSSKLDSTEQPSSPSAAAAGDLFAAGIPRKKRTMTYIVDDSLSEEKQVHTSDSTEQPSPFAAAAVDLFAAGIPRKKTTMRHIVDDSLPKENAQLDPDYVPPDSPASR